MDSEKTDKSPPESVINRFSERLSLTLQGKSIRGFARDCGLSEGVLRSYLRGDTYPSLDRLDAIARAAGISGGWLATGEGRMRSADTFEARESREEYRPMNQQLLGDIIEQVEFCLQERGTELAPAKKKELILMAYDLFLPVGKIDSDTIIRLLNLAR